MSCVSGDIGCYAFLWKIENFEYFVRRNNINLLSPTFMTHWKLEISSKSVKTFDYLCLRLRNVDLKEGKVHLEVSILAGDDTVIRYLNSFSAIVSEWTCKSCADIFPLSKIVESNVHLFPPKYTLKVLIRIWQQGIQSEQHLARTVFYNETWNIGRLKNNQETKTKSFQLASRHFDINLESGSCAKDVTVHAETVQKKGEHLHFARCQLYIVCSDGKEPTFVQEYSSKSVHTRGDPSPRERSSEATGLAWGSMIRLKQEHLNDSLSLKYEFTIATNEICIDPVPKLLDPPIRATLHTRYVLRAVPPEGLDKDLWRMYSEKKFCDVTLKSSSGKEFPAHKSILSARSTVFGAMFEDKTLATVDLPDVDSSTLSRMLIFIYGDYSLNLHWKEACWLYYAAKKYSIEPLQQECLSVLKRELTVPTACKALEVTQVCVNEALKQCVWDFIQENYDEVIESDEWKSLEENNPKLAIQMYRELGLQKFKKSD